MTDECERKTGVSELVINGDELSLPTPLENIRLIMSVSILKMFNNCQMGVGGSRCPDRAGGSAGARRLRLPRHGGCQRQET